MDALVDAVNQGTRYNQQGSTDAAISRTMVFANTVDAVESIAKILQTAGIQCFSYHRNTSLEECTKNLVDFGERGGVLVCTDAAARGLDIPNISHVVQVLRSMTKLGKWIFTASAKVLSCLGDRKVNQMGK